MGSRSSRVLLCLPNLRMTIAVVVVALVPSFVMPSDCRIAMGAVASTPRAEFMRPGFSMTELMITTAVIGTLIAILLPSLANARRTARDVKCEANLRSAHQILMMYQEDYKVLPVHHYTFGRPMGQNSASVDLHLAIEINSAIRKAFECPEDRGFTVDGASPQFYSYLYSGLAAMAVPRPPWGYNPAYARVRYETVEPYKPLRLRLPLWHDARPFHRSRQGPPDYSDGQTRAVWYDGTVDVIPLR